MFYFIFKAEKDCDRFVYENLIYMRERERERERESFLELLELEMCRRQMAGKHHFFLLLRFKEKKQKILEC
jgi:hypothetical protein